ncbi:endonuclease/exonuclease/phosphatase family protein [Paenibacillus sp. FSL K6-1230]|uniref:endonuclease/exonuclease/phosphatase family protein n=1 Tax=Paenibacillus sp. FSL K6-1230 TaxID=2921603 RepID=UPI0030F81270
MKLLTLNTHSWLEEDQLAKITYMADFINEHEFDVIAFQEVNQMKTETVVPLEQLGKFVVTDSSMPIRANNYAYLVQQQLKADYYWTWAPVHTGKLRYDEGLAFLSRTPIGETFCEHVSGITVYNNYKTRKILGASTTIEGAHTWIVNGHLGWWHDEEEPFRPQWDRVEAILRNYTGDAMFLMGDFNNVAELSGEGYDYMMSKGWCDLYTAAEIKDAGATVTKSIGGWEGNTQDLRIDYIFSREARKVKSSTVVMNGIRGEVVSDHFGVAVEL